MLEGGNVLAPFPRALPPRIADAKSQTRKNSDCPVRARARIELRRSWTRAEIGRHWNTFSGAAVNLKRIVLSNLV